MSVVALAFAASNVPGALAEGATASRLDAARQELERINASVDAQLAELANLRDEAADLAAQTDAAEAALATAEERLDETKARIGEVESRYTHLASRLERRASQMYMSSGSELAAMLSASSVGEVADQMEFFSSIAGADTDLANEVNNARVELERMRAEQADAVKEQQETYDELQANLADLQDRFEREQALTRSIEQDRQQAEELVDGLREQYQDELAAQVPPPPEPPAASDAGGSTGTTGPTGPNPFQVCPVGDPHAATDSFGAPRYGGGYHVHAGSDIMAPEGVPIYATFPGTASDVSNDLGGLSVKVTGAQGWTYNAHMVRIGQLGSVQTGDVIGWVGATGDTSTPHNHFEWHPNTLPASWPASAYGYSIVGDAVNPYPLLVGVC